VNYYGNQRFGGARAGEGFLAPLLIKGKFEEALKIILATPHRKDMRQMKFFKQTCRDNWGQWKAMIPKLPKMQLRLPIEKLASRPDDFKGAFQALPYFEQQMAVEAWQSLLWNRTACRLVETHCAPCREIDDTYCKLAFPDPAAVPATWRHLMLPVLGKNTDLKEPWKSAAHAVLEEESITTADLKIPGVERPWFAEVERQLFIEATNFHASNPQQDETQDKSIRFKRTLSFTLPRGCYATVLLRALGH
jgi:tRNA(Glu) U13 pseudouridine synthase TruD